MSANQKIEKWKKWLITISNEVRDLVRSCKIYSEIRQIVTSNPRINTSNLFYDWITRNYVDATLMGIRRQLDDHCDSVSLKNLLSDMKNNLDLLSRERHLALYSEERLCLGNKGFDSLAGEGINNFPLERLEQDIEQLEKIRSLHKTYVDRRIAHYDKVRKVEVIGTFKDLDNAVSSLEEIVSRYDLLIRANYMPSLLPLPTY